MADATQPTSDAPLARPRTVTVAFWVFLALTAGRVAYLPVTVVARWNRADSAALGTGSASTSVALTPDLMHGALITGAVEVLALFGLCAWAAFRMRRGGTRARVVLTVLAALTIVSVVVTGGLVSLPFGLAGAAGIILLWVRPSSDWFRAVKAERLAAPAQRIPPLR